MMKGLNNMICVKSHEILQGEKALTAAQHLEKGIVIMNVNDLPQLKTNNKYAITVKPDLYLNSEGYAVQWTNHSCDPNLRFDNEKLEFITIKEIQEGEMLTFDYTLTEPSIEGKFDCVCGAKNCKGRIE